MFYRIVTGGYKKGLIVGKNRTEIAAQKALNKDLRSPLYTTSDCLVVYETPAELEVGAVNSEAAEQCIFIHRQQVGLMLMLELLELRQNEADTNFLCERITVHEWSLESLEKEFLEQAQAIIAKREERQRKAAERHALIVATQSELSKQRAEFTYTFPAVAGIQAGKQYYVAQIPYKALIRLFTFDDEFIPAELRAQRQLNEARAKKISQYVTDNTLDYVLPALTASCDTSMHFEAAGVEGANNRIGLLHIPMDAILLINDGQHRRRGIELALKENRCLADETVALTLYYDQGLKQSQQMFADINANQVKPSSAINTLYNHRNDYSVWVLDLLAQMPEIKFRVEMETASIGKKSLKLWSIVAIKKAISILTGYTDKNFHEATADNKANSKDLVIGFFNALSDHLPFWSQMVEGQIAASEVRESLLIGHAVFLEALCIVGRIVIEQNNSELWSPLQSLSHIDVSKAAKCWHGRCIVMGRMNKSTAGVKSTALQLCTHVGILPPPELREFEQLKAG